MPYAFGTASRDHMKGVDPRMVKVLERAIQISPVDFKVIEGVRTPQRQKKLYAQGRTEPGQIVTWTLKSNHFVDPKTGFGRAVDLLPAPYDWKDPGQFDKMSRAMFEAARQVGVKIRWGADWDQDGKARERGESDSPHFELAL